jgi:hypothetical protein
MVPEGLYRWERVVDKVLVRNDMKKLSRDQICMLTLFFALDPIPHTPTTVTIPSVDCCENPALYVIVGWVSMVIKGGGE